MNLTAFNKFMALFLPKLVEQRMQLQTEEEKNKIWLERQLQEYAGWGEEERKTSKEKLFQSLIGTLTTPKFYEERALPEYQILNLLRKVAPEEEFTKRFNIPTDIETAIPEAESAIKNMILKTQGLQPSQIPALEESDLAGVIKAFGPKTVTDMLNEISGQKAGIEERGLRGRELEKAIKEMGLRGREVTVREEELELEKKGGKTKKEEEKKLEKLWDERDSYIDKSVGIGSPIGMYTESQIKMIKAKTSVIDRQIKELEKGFDKKVLARVMPTEEDKKEFIKMALHNKAINKEIKWEDALVQGFDLTWLNALRERIEGKKK